MSKRKSESTIARVEFIDRVIKLDEKGEPFSLAPYQRRVLEMALRRDPSGELMFRLVVLSEPKNRARPFVAACLALWWAQSGLTPRTITKDNIAHVPVTTFPLQVRLTHVHSLTWSKDSKVRVGRVHVNRAFGARREAEMGLYSPGNGSTTENPTAEYRLPKAYGPRGSEVR